MDLKAWKTIKATLISGLVAGFGAFAIANGADPTSTGLVALLIIAVLNGVELQELAAVKGVQIVRDRSSSTQEDEER